MPALPDLSSAIDAGIISSDVAQSLQLHFAGQNKHHADEENFRLVSGFNDIFVVIASLLLLVSATALGFKLKPWLGPLLGGVIAWGLSEFFIRKKRMALPAIILLVIFVIESGLTAGAIMVSAHLHFFGGPAILGVVSCTAGIVAAFVHWRRFRVPITVAIAVASGIGLLYAAIFAWWPAMRDFLGIIYLIAGLITLTLAMRWDAQDTRRQTRRSDVAFWLHLLAAPLIIHSTFSLMGGRAADLQAWQAIVFIAIYFLIGIISLIIDRRAMMVSALTYVLYALSSLLKTYGMVTLGFAATAFVIGSALLLLSAFWHRARAPLVRRLPQFLQRILPEPA